MYQPIPTHELLGVGGTSLPVLMNSDELPIDWLMNFHALYLYVAMLLITPISFLIEFGKKNNLKK